MWLLQELEPYAANREPNFCKGLQLILTACEESIALRNEFDSRTVTNRGTYLLSTSTVVESSKEYSINSRLNARTQDLYFQHLDLLATLFRRPVVRFI